MNKFTAELRFATYLLVGLTVLSVSYATHEPLIDFTRNLGLSFRAFGRTFEFGQFLLGACALSLSFAGALVAEYLLTGGQHSSLRRLANLRSKSVRTDWVFLVLIFTPFLMAVVINITTFGSMVIANNWMRAHVSPDLHLFDQSVAAFGWTATIVLFFVSRSFLDYWQHRLFHTKLFWPLHRMHHAADELTLATSIRVHPAGLFLYPLVGMLPTLLWGAPEEFMLLFYAFYLYHEFLVHSDADIEWGWIGRYVQGAPVNHKVHHSAAPEHFDKNFSTNLPIWDRLFGTFHYSPTVARVGLDLTPEEQRRPIVLDFLVDMRDFWQNVGHTSILVVRQSGRLLRLGLVRLLTSSRTSSNAATMVENERA